MFINYLKIALRHLKKNKVSTLINSIGLTIGMSACIIILLFVQYESTFDKHHKKSDLTYRVVQHTKYPEKTFYWNTTAYPMAAAMRVDLPQIEYVTQTSGPSQRFFTFEDEQGQRISFEEPYVLFTDNYYHKVFDVTWLAGNPDEALKIENGVVLTERLLLKYFKKDKETDYGKVIGKTLLLNGKDPLVVTGIIKDHPGNNNQKYNMLISYSFFKKHNRYPSENWGGNYQGTTFITLQNKALENELITTINKWKSKYLDPEDDIRITYALQPIEEIHNESLYGSSPGGYIMPGNLLTIAKYIAWFILFIAIVNFVNLTTAQSIARSKEVGIRKILGSKPIDLLKLFFIENALLIISIVIASLSVVHMLLGLLNKQLNIINLELQLEWHHINLILIVSCITIILAAIYPALILVRFKPIQTLKNNVFIQKRGELSLRKSLVVFQFIVVQIFVIGAIIVGNQMRYFNQKDTGFDKNAIVITPTTSIENQEAYQQELMQQAAITNVAFGSGPPMAVDGFQLGTTFRLPNQTEDEGFGAEMKTIDPNYIEFYDLELIAGTNIKENKPRFDEFIVNERTIEMMGWNPQEAIGKQLAINEGVATIVGVVKDFHNNSLQNEITPCILLNWIPFKDNAFIKLAKLDATTLSTIEKTWKDQFSRGVYSYRFLDESMAKEYTVEKLIDNGFRLFSLIAISIGCLGLIGLMAFITTRRIKEIGIRKVLGAGLIKNIIYLSREYIILVLIAFMIASPIIYYFMEKWLQGFTYTIPINIWMFITGGMVTLGIALLTCSYQSAKAALINPIQSLKSE